MIRCDSQNDELKTNVFLLNHFLFFSFIYPFHNLRFQSVKIKWHIIMRLWLSKSKQNMDAKFSVSMRKHFKNQIKTRTIPDIICCKVSVFQQMKIMTLQKYCMHTCSCLHLNIWHIVFRVENLNERNTDKKGCDFFLKTKTIRFKTTSEALK